MGAPAVPTGMRAREGKRERAREREEQEAAFWPKCARTHAIDSKAESVRKRARARQSAREKEQAREWVCM